MICSGIFRKGRTAKTKLRQPAGMQLKQRTNQPDLPAPDARHLCCASLLETFEYVLVLYVYCFWILLLLIYCVVTLHPGKEKLKLKLFGGTPGEGPDEVPGRQGPWRSSTTQRGDGRRGWASSQVPPHDLQRARGRRVRPSWPRGRRDARVGSDSLCCRGEAGRVGTGQRAHGVTARGRRARVWTWPPAGEAAGGAKASGTAQATRRGQNMHGGSAPGRSAAGTQRDRTQG